MKKVIKKWTDLEETQLEYLRTIEKRPIKWIAKKMGRTPTSVRRKCQNMGIQQHHQWDEEQTNRVMDEIECLAKREKVDPGALLSRATKAWYGRV